MLAPALPDDHGVEPICSLAADCGGCLLQGLSQSDLLARKSARVAQALHRAGFDIVPAAPSVQAALRTRRRMDLGIARTARGDVMLGLHRSGSRTVIDMTECHILEATLFDLLAPLRPVLRSLQALRQTGSLLVNLLDDGPDLLLGTDREPDAGDRSRLAAFALDHRVCRIAWRDERGARRDPPEILVQLTPARLTLAGRPVDIPPGAFLQPTRDGQSAITQAVIAGLPNPMPTKSRVVELYAGCGTLTFALAAHARVLAVEGDAASADALAGAAGGIRIEVLRRDLARRPLDSFELRGAAAIVLDPPYAGAGGQIEQVALAASGIVIIVSCNPAALSKEAGTLRRAGYRLDRVTTIDQFLFSPHVESVSVFRRENSRRTRSGPSR